MTWPRRRRFKALSNKATKIFSLFLDFNFASRATRKTPCRQTRKAGETDGQEQRIICVGRQETNPGPGQPE